MGAKVVWYREAWRVRTHHQGKKRDRRIGPATSDRRQAEEIAKKVTAAIVLGTYGTEKSQAPLPCDAELRRWLTTYSSTMKHSSEVSARYLIDRHLAPHFGTMDLRALRETDLLEFALRKLSAGLAPKTIRNALGVLRRVLYVLQRAGGDRA